MTFQEWWAQRTDEDMRDDIVVAASAAWDEATLQAERKGFGPGFGALARAAEPIAARLVDLVRVNTPDLTGRGVVKISAGDIAEFAHREIVAERERCMSKWDGTGFPPNANGLWVYRQGDRVYVCTATADGAELTWHGDAVPVGSWLGEWFGPIQVPRGAEMTPFQKWLDKTFPPGQFDNYRTELMASFARQAWDASKVDGFEKIGQLCVYFTKAAAAKAIVRDYSEALACAMRADGVKYVIDALTGEDDDRLFSSPNVPSASPPALKWTRDKPTVAGHYLYRLGWPASKQVDSVKIELSRGLELVAQVTGQFGFWNLIEMRGEWYGPLEVPQ